MCVERERLPTGISLTGVTCVCVQKRHTKVSQHPHKHSALYPHTFIASSALPQPFRCTFGRAHEPNISASKFKFLDDIWVDVILENPLDQCFPTFRRDGTLDLALHISRCPFEENKYFFKLIYFLIISYLRDITVYCCWVSVYSLINDVKMNVI